MELPTGVTNEKAWEEYLVLKKALDNNKDRIFQTSDPQIRVDLLTTIHILRKMVKHLPYDEQDIIFGKTTAFRKLLQEANLKKREAHGTVQKNDKGETINILTPKHSEIIELFGKFYKAEEVHEICLRDWGYDISIDIIRKFQKKHIDKIKELQDEYSSKYSDVRLGYKRSRLDELSWLYSQIKQKYLANGSKDDARQLESLLKTIKAEVEGDLVINGKMQIDVQETLNIQVQQEMIKDFNITALVISKLAGRLNVNPLMILSRLSNSHYAKFTGFKEPTISREDDEIYSPTNITYDWDKIISKNQDIVQEQKKLGELKQIQDEPKVISLKDRLMAAMREKQGTLNKTVISIDKLQPKNADNENK
jgi:hypothetical protein